MSQEIANNLLKIAAFAQDVAQAATDFKLYDQARDVERVGLALQAIEKLCQAPPYYNRVDLHFYSMGDDEIDYEIVGTHKTGPDSGIASDLNTGSFIRALFEIANREEVKRVIAEAEQEKLSSLSAAD